MLFSLGRLIAREASFFTPPNGLKLFPLSLSPVQSELAEERERRRGEEEEDVLLPWSSQFSSFARPLSVHFSTELAILGVFYLSRQLVLTRPLARQ